MGIFLIKIVLLARGKIMKVAIFCDYLHSFGGTEYYNATLAMELKKRGIDVRVFICEKTQNSYWIDRLADYGIKIYEPARKRIDRDDRSVDYEFVDSFIDMGVPGFDTAVYKDGVCIFRHMSKVIDIIINLSVHVNFC